ncbi:MAG TPA: PTS sugar transporter subunit IIB [Pseudonocardiaceae bacterium]|jgi:PTS system mannose-specific IIB component|nr:PTS sugar transporter subunit IIB [Pseudonocardiaceae bacterium]
MPVKHMRIDNRLIHGQVTVSWVGTVGANHLIVSNDEVAGDEFQRVLLPQAARGVRTSVLSIADTVAYCLSPQAAQDNIMILAKFPSDAARLLAEGVRPEVVNVGNQAPKPGSKFTMVTRSISVTAEDAALYRTIAEQAGGLHSQMMPSDRAEDFLRLLTKKKL